MFLVPVLKAHLHVSPFSPFFEEIAPLLQNCSKKLPHS
ncbi:hypothetical protein D0808_12425 [Bacillus subtilis]|nr:hypothetical protein D0808_12425 [Bacillus subtilis]